MSYYLTEALYDTKAHNSGRNLPETPNTGMSGRLFSLTMANIEVDARFLDSESGTKGSGRSMNRKLGRVSGGWPNERRHALGKPRIDPVVTGSAPFRLTNASRKLVIDDPGAKKFPVIILMSTRRSPSYKKKRAGCEILGFTKGCKKGNPMAHTR